MPAPLDLPGGYTQRALSFDDAAGVTAVMAAQELADVGQVVIEEADIVADWQRPSYDVTQSSVGVLDGGTLVAYAEIAGGDRGDAAVHPDHRGRGIGTALARWMQELAREQGKPVVGMPVPQGSPGDRLLETLGYHVRWTSWELELPGDASIPDRPLPEGYAIREATQDDYRAAWAVNEDAFLEWSERERQSFDDWTASVPRRPGFEPWNLRVATDPAGEVVAVSVILRFQGNGVVEGYVDRLATRRDQRGRGLAQALLADSFATARAHGAVRSALSTDTRTGALGALREGRDDRRVDLGQPRHRHRADNLEPVPVLWEGGAMAHFVTRYDFRAPGADPATRRELFGRAVEQAAYLDEHGEDALILSEHHASDDGYLPSPIPVASAFAAVTSRVPITISALLANFYDPVRLAEEIAVLDHLSGGRVSYTIGLGYRREEYDHFGRPWTTRGADIERLIQVLQQAWSGEPFEHDGRRVRVTPTPYSQPHPMLFYGGGSVAAARRAGRLGLHFAPQHGDPALHAAYEEECRARGREPGVILRSP